MFWLLVLSPMDSGFVGPFNTRAEAETYKSGLSHDSYIYTDAERAENIAEFGKPGYTQEPEGE